ncbi:MAG: DNA gyrase inhibitor YacG [Rhodospirillaceae bacterium]|nr:MAG: DNA gyrase inhibitor YacG [Rhodospirillaceae bacterium]
MPDQTKKPSNVVELKTAKKASNCPMCKKKTDQKFKPFCSKHCADLDLGKWLDGGYRVPAEELLGAYDDFDEED